MGQVFYDSLVNFWKKNACKAGSMQTGGPAYPYSAYTSNPTYATGHYPFTLDTRDMDPSRYWVHLREKVRFHLYNTSNVIAYLTISKQRPRYTTDSASPHMRKLLISFPTHYKFTPLGNIAGADNQALTWGYPASASDYKTLANCRNDPFVPVIKDGVLGGEPTLGLSLLRWLGAFIMRFPYEPKPNFLPIGPNNFWNLGVTATAPTIGVAGAGGVNMAAFTPITGAGTGGIGMPVNTCAATGVDFISNRTQRTDNNLSGFAISQLQTFTGPVVGANTSKWNDPAGSNAGAIGKFSTVNWSVHPEYEGDKRNPIFKRLYKTSSRRFTLPPGGAIRFTVKSKLCKVNPLRHNLMNSVLSPWAGDTTSQNTCAWGVGNIDGTGVINSPSCRARDPYTTMPVTFCLRGQTATGTTTDACQVMPTECLLKKDHSVFYNMYYKTPPLVKHHTTLRNMLSADTNTANFKIYFPTSVPANAAPSPI
jgi:hypothetical protein